MKFPSKKICQKENYIGFTGAPYLMIKSNEKGDHAEKRHIDSRINYTERKMHDEKKHFENV